jgi:hypothetical protein
VLARVAAVALAAAACQGAYPVDDMDAALRDAGGGDGAEELDLPARDGGDPGAEVGPDGRLRDGAGGVDGGLVDAATVLDGPAGTSTTPMACAGTVVLPSFDRSCTDDRDCVAVTHQISCCGSQVALGLNKKELDTFTRAETMCAASYPACGCPALPTRTEDGSSTPGLAGDIAVACREGTCTTFVKGCGGPCGASTTCACCPIGPTQYCVCTTTGCMGNGDCTDPARPTCQRAGFPSLCTAAGVACFVP